MTSPIPALSFLHNLDGWSHREREVDRAILAGVAPDREELLISKLSIEEIRQALKLRVDSESVSGHWLHHVQRRENVKLQSAAPRRLSICSDGQINEPVSSKTSARMYIVRRAERSPSLSISSSQEESAGINQEITLERTSVDFANALISPRPLGPTHILIAHAIPSQPIVKGSTVKRHRSPSIHTETLEIPINDLLFLLNVPNIAYDYSLALHGTVLPHRSGTGEELPMVSMGIPHLRTFAEIVVYLHTKNQAALFRALIPEWARDIMHPLPPAPDPSPNVSLGYIEEGECVPSSLCCAGSACSLGGNIGRLFKSCVFSGSRRQKCDIQPLFASQENMARSVNTIGVEMAEAAGRQPDDEEALSAIAETLDALSDNLSYLGYFNKALWNELNVYRAIVMYAISYRARIPLEDEAY